MSGGPKSNVRLISKRSTLASPSTFAYFLSPFPSPLAGAFHFSRSYAQRDNSCVVEGHIVSVVRDVSVWKHRNVGVPILSDTDVGVFECTLAWWEHFWRVFSVNSSLPSAWWIALQRNWQILRTRAFLWLNTKAGSLIALRYERDL